MVNLQNNNLIVVADSHHLTLIARNKGTEFNHLKVFRKILYGRPEPLERVKRGRPGKIVDRQGIFRGSYLDDHLDEKQDLRFLKAACKIVDQEFNQNRFSHIVLVAEAKVMKFVKMGLSNNMKSKVIAEIFKNYSKTPIANLENALQQISV